MQQEPPSHSTSIGPSSGIDPPHVQAEQAVGLPAVPEGRLKRISKAPPYGTGGHKHGHKAGPEASDEGHARPPPHYTRQRKVNDTVGTLAGGGYSNKDIVVAVISEVVIHVFVVSLALQHHKSYITNVTTTIIIIVVVNLGCKLDLKAIALQARNAEYNPKVCTGSKSEQQSKLAARKYARIIQKLGFPAKFKDFKIQNIVGSCDVKFPIRLEGLAYSHGAPFLVPGHSIFFKIKQLLLVIDRRDDPVTPLPNQWTYQEVVLSSEQDAFFKANMYENFGDVGMNIKQLVDEFQQISKSNQSIQTMEDLAKFADKYPEYKKMHGNVSKHVTLVIEMSKIVEERKLMLVSETEQELACNGGQVAAFEVWFMGEHSHISMDFDNIISVTLENYMDLQISSKNGKEDDLYSQSQDQWVQGVVKAEERDSSFPDISKKAPSLPSALTNPHLDPTM
ncbi:hypothetical protein SO802_028784 [Lithocarpus litseifolius]|uniref:Uncharacterized protein n=1 Tax=Lithocarpus litseifolius TaxID=425828 RepID=A0AAW2BWW6_9ROSI